MIRSIIILAVVIIIPGIIYTQNPTDMRSRHEMVKENDTGNYKIQRSEKEWKDILEPDQYYVLRRAGTERAFTGLHYKTSKPGIYYSAATGQPLFASDSKFDSGCGWPSFFEPIVPDAILYRKDRSHGMVRTEIIDSGSGSHLGHVFDDGPPPTGLRYCMNSAAMIFVEKGDEEPAIVREYMDRIASDKEKEAVSSFLGSL
ncbi:MAG: peptide-methionine (R)-S-oxide reductase MsrB [Bacteroidales bacterium]